MESVLAVQVDIMELTKSSKGDWYVTSCISGSKQPFVIATKDQKVITIADLLGEKVASSSDRCSWSINCLSDLERNFSFHT